MNGWLQLALYVGFAVFLYLLYSGDDDDTNQAT